MIAVLVAGIVGMAVFGESTDFIDWSSEVTDSANCGLQETQAQLECPDESGVLDIRNDMQDQCD